MSIYLRVFKGNNNEDLADLMQKKSEPSLSPSPLDYIVYLGKITKSPFEENADLYY